MWFGYTMLIYAYAKHRELDKPLKLGRFVEQEVVVLDIARDHCEDIV